MIERMKDANPSEANFLAFGDWGGESIDDIEDIWKTT